MGHANVSNLYNLFIRRVYAAGRLSIAEAVELAIEKEEWFHASEGDYEDRSMLAMGFEHVISELRRSTNPVLVPWVLSITQRCVLRKWGTREWDDSPDVYTKRQQEALLVAADTLETVELKDLAADLRRRAAIPTWEDGGDDLLTGDLGILCSIKWKFAPGWRKEYPHGIPPVSYFEN